MSLLKRYSSAENCNKNMIAKNSSVGIATTNVDSNDVKAQEEKTRMNVKETK